MSWGGSLERLFVNRNKNLYCSKDCALGHWPRGFRFDRQNFDVLSFSSALHLPSQLAYKGCWPCEAPPLLLAFNYPSRNVSSLFQNMTQPLQQAF